MKRPTVFAVLSFTAAALLEIGASYFLLDFTDSEKDLLIFLGIHTLASVILATVVRPSLPVQYREPKLVVTTLLFAIIYFIPIFGVFGILAAVLVNVLSPKPGVDAPFAQVQAPEYVLSIREPTQQFRISSMRTMLLDETIPSEVRIKSLIALQSMPTRVAGPTIRKLLGDPADDIRLLAYGILDNKEKELNAQIVRAAADLKAATSGERRLQALRQLAELHWEMVYTGLSQGDLRDHTLAQTAGFLETAMQIAARDAALWFLSGRVLHAQGKIDDAAQAFHIAVTLGMDESRVLAYVAEIAFEQRRFDLVRDYVTRLARSQVTATMAPIIRFWQRSKAA